MDKPDPVPRTPLELVMFAAWVNVPVDKLPPDMRGHTCPATMAAWKRVAEAALAYRDAPNAEAALAYRDAPNAETGMIDVWMEGFAANSETGTAHKLGTFKAATLAEAVAAWAATGPALAAHLNKEHTAVWGCRLFDNEADARKNFG
jgi:hypothetical protein